MLTTQEGGCAEALIDNDHDSDSKPHTSFTLPQEILGRIFRVCVEPYDLKLYPKIHNGAQMISELEYIPDNPFGHSGLRLPPPEDEPDTVIGHGNNELFVNHPTTNIVTHVYSRTSPDWAFGNYSYLAGLPKLTNLKLINRMFSDEVTAAIKQRFNGTLDVQSSIDFFRAPRKKGWKPAGPIEWVKAQDQFTWIRPLVTDLKVHWNELYPLFYHKWYTSLRTITMSSTHFPIVKSKNWEDFASGQWDKGVLSLNSPPGVELCRPGVKSLHDRDVKVMLLYDLYIPLPTDSPYYDRFIERSNELWFLRFEWPKSHVPVIISRGRTTANERDGKFCYTHEVVKA